MSDDLGEVLDLGLSELLSRMKNESVVSGIPDYALLKLVGDLVKMQVKQQEVEEEETRTVLDVVKEGRLPVETGREMLLDELRSLDEYRDQVIEALEGMNAREEVQVDSEPRSIRSPEEEGVLEAERGPDFECGYSGA